MVSITLSVPEEIKKDFQVIFSDEQVDVALLELLDKGRVEYNANRRLVIVE